MADKFGIGSENWDALRARTLSLPHDAGGNTIVDAGNLGLGNKIILYDSGGLDLRLYPPTQAGLEDALSDATDGDTVWLPSIPIVQTAGVIMPAGVALRGIGHKAILSASGFNGTAVKMDTGALCSGFSLDFASTLSSDIGIDAGFEDAIVHDVWVDVDEGIGIELGGAILAEEAWFLMQFNNSAAGTGSIVYSTDAFVSDTNQPTWKICPRPSNAENIWDTGGSRVGTFAILEDGSSAYVAGKRTGEAFDDWAIWRTDNPRAVSPTWAVIMAKGDTTISGVTFVGCSHLERHCDLIVALFRTTSGGGIERVYAEYNTVTSTWTFFDINTILNPNDARDMRAAYRAFTRSTTTWELREPVASALIDDSGADPAIGTLTSNVWLNRASGPLLYNLHEGSPNQKVLRDATNGVNQLTGFTAANVGFCVIRGHLQGSGVAFVEDNGELASNVWVSDDDGDTWTEKTAWGSGDVEFVGQETGQGRAGWIKRIADNNTEMFRKTADIFAVTPTWNDRSGNFWGTQAQVNAGTAIMPNEAPFPDLAMRNFRTVYR